ncbi:MAG TPA: aminotransferase class III-fold pyridoxal phosphate-dependent enzyme [Gemmatimonadaceae bacterium]
MPFGRLFRGRSQQPAPEREPDDALTDETAVEEEGGDEPDVPPEWDATGEDVERSWRARARDILPGGSSTGSKRPEALYGEGNESGPSHFVRAAGCHLTTPGEITLIDCTMALGSVALGYGDERVLRAAVAAAATGNVAGLPHTAEVELAERLCDLIPCAEQVRFLKSGADAVSAAVRIARTATGRSGVVGCGYFGWHDWSSTGEGIPDGVRGSFHAVPFDDVPALEGACRRAGNDLAAVVIEPVIERLPSDDWIAAARRLCDELGAVLVFDELKTGFRLARGGYQELAGVKPDLAAFGKAMANGFPLAAVVGKREVMEATSRTWISSTLAGESMSIAAALAVLDVYEGDEDVCATLARVGGAMRSGVDSAVTASGIDGVIVGGLDPMWFMRFADATVERRFLEEAVREGVLFKRGAYNYASLAHDEEETIVEIERAASSALVAIVNAGDE